MIEGVFNWKENQEVTPSSTITPSTKRLSTSPRRNAKMALPSLKFIVEDQRSIVELEKELLNSELERTNVMRVLRLALI